MAKTLRAVTAIGFLLAGFGVADPFTPKHEAGRCAIRGTCGKQSIFGGELPCADNGPAEEPDDDVRSQLVELCGQKWSSGLVCCKKEQVRHRCRPSPWLSILMTAFADSNSQG